MTTLEATGPSPAAAHAVEAATPAGDGTTLRGRAAERWRRARWVVAVAAVVLLAALIWALSLSRGGVGRDLDPTNAAPDGARAVAQILRAQGVRVDRVEQSVEAARLATSQTTLVVVDTSLLGPAQLDRLGATEAQLVLVQPDLLVLSRLAPGIRPRGVVEGTVRPPQCRVAAATTAGEALAGGRLYGAGNGGTVCYPDAEDPGAGSYVTTRAGGRTVTVIGQRDVLSNARLADDGNAALALHTLGGQPGVVWYMPDPLEPATDGGPGGPGGGRDGRGPGGIGALLPSWVSWVTLQLAVVVLVAMIWRARRLGRLVTEPLPVVVRAAETEEGRARLYRQAAARGRAAATLRTAALRRLATRLAVPPGTSPQEVAVLAAAATGRHESDVHAVLLGSAPTNDTELVKLADALDALERDVAGGSQPGGSRARAPRTDGAEPGRNAQT